MSSAPPGWHLQPDGRERYWDGTDWTDEFRDPSSAATQEIPIDHTRGIPATDGSGYVSPRQSGREYAAPAPGYQPPAPHRDSYPREPYYEGPGGPLSDRPGGTPGWMKGCLGFLIALVLIAVAGLVAAVWWLDREVSGGTTQPSSTQTTAAEEPTPESTTLPPPALPTGLPSGFPTELPTAFPTGLPTGLPSVPGQGVSVTVRPGEGFALGPAKIQSGWAVEEAAFGFRTVSMQAAPIESSRMPLIFQLTFIGGDVELASTMCTVALSEVGQNVDVGCLPMRADVAAAGTVRADGMGN